MSKSAWGRKTAAKRQAARSGLEEKNIKLLESWGIDPQYETLKLPYVRPQSNHTYTPDFRLPNGIIVETKGRFLPEDRTKHLHVKACHPKLDIRFVFSRARTPIYKGSKTTYADWCEKNGFQWAEKLIPREWIEE